MSIKVYLQYNENDHPEKSSKLSIPASWQTKTVADVIQLFVKPYNEKNPDHLIDVAQVHLTTKEGNKIFSNATVAESLGDHGDFLIKPGAHVKGVYVKVQDSRPRCKNYGCNQHFTEDENNDDACCHHTGPPIFHDTAKFWSCCKDRKAWDFESFQALTGCARGRHSTEDPQISIGASPNANKPINDEKDSNAPILKSISDYNESNQEAVTAATAAVETLSQKKSSRKEDGTARCQRKGCQKIFKWETENSADACRYHKGQPVFHDVAKFWSCCSEKKCYDFDAFLAVPGCEVGYHDDGVIELN